MKLYDLIELCEEGQEITVTDFDYDIEVYFENKNVEERDAWDEAMVKISKLLDVVKIGEGFTINVNLSQTIEAKIDALENADLFIDCDVDSIMEDIENVFAGYVSESWLTKFAETLEGK